MTKTPLEKLINRLIYTDQMDECTLVIVHRGVEDDRQEIDGEEIQDMTDRFIETRSGRGIPLHRIEEVRKGGEVLWNG